MNNFTKLYITLTALYCAIIVAANLIFQKYVKVDLYVFSLEVSVAVLMYPITFLITDLVSEFYPRKYAEFIPATGIFISVSLCAIVFVADSLNATAWSPMDNSTFHKYFGLYGLVVFSSIIVNFIAQIIDIRIYKFLKHLCKDKHLWIRNNVSTITAQAIDTILITTIFYQADLFAYENYWNLIIDNIIFKTIIALLDTPVLYSLVFLVRKLGGNSIAKRTSSFLTLH